MSKKMNFTQIFERIAAEQNTTVQEVHREIEIVIRAGFNNPDPKVQEQWARIPRAGDVPTPDELLSIPTLHCGNSKMIWRERLL